MKGTYDLWLVSCSFLVAVIASYAALELAGRVVVSHGRATWAWLAGGSVAMGLGIWSMHFIGMLAFHLPIPLTYEVWITLLSVVPAILSASLVLALVRGRTLSGFRLTAGAVVLGCGVAAMHYAGMAAIPIQPAIRYDPVIFTVSVAVAIVAAFVALKLAFSLSGSASRRKKFGAALVMAGGICAMHYTGMAAAVFAPDSVCTVAPGAIQQTWLAGIIAFNTVIVLLVTIAIAFYDARLADQNARAAETLKAANDELRDSEARFRGMLESAPDAIIIVDRNGKIVLVNSQTERFFGYTRGELLDKAVEIVIPDRFRGKHPSYRDRFVADSSVRPMGAGLDLYGRRRDGTEFPVEISLSSLATGGDILVISVIRDVTERKKSDQEIRKAHADLAAGVGVLEQRNREITLLAELGNFLLSCVTVEEACNVIPKYCETLFPGEHGALYLFRASRDHLNPYASWGVPKAENLPFKPEDCWALRRGRSHTVADPRKDAICAHVAAPHEGRPHMCVPLVVQGDLLGLMWITLVDSEPSGDGTNAPKNGRQQLAVALSEQIALALSNIRLREDLRQQTIRDALTGLYNRRFLEESLNREMARCKRNGAFFGVLMVDVDHFKRFNDTFGHDAGDSVLREVARTLQENTREGDIVCRYGGEEFVLVLPDTNREGAATRAERPLAAVRDLHVTHNGRALGLITASIGLAMSPRNGGTVKTIVQSADTALYAAKGAGRDRVVVAE